MMVASGGGWRLPEVRETPVFFVPGGTSQAISAQATTEIGDLIMIFAYGTGGSVPDEGSPGTLFTTIDSESGTRKGRVAYRIASSAGTHSLSTWTATSSYGIATFKKNSFDAVAPFDTGGLTDELFVSEPDGHVVYPALTTPPVRKTLMIGAAYSNLTASFGAITGATTGWNQTTGGSYSRMFYKYQQAAFAGENVNHVSGTPAQTLGFLTYLKGKQK
jgi:hypothetical protein